MHRICSFIVALLLSLSGESQNFDYSFSKDSVAWQELNTQTILNSNNAAWNFSYTIPIGFSFNYLGHNFDSLRIETNGYLVFDANRNYALTAFSGFGDCVDTSGNHSVLGYQLSGSTGNHILKIQFKNTSNVTLTKHFSYQIWLKEDGSIEIRVGSNDFQPGYVVTANRQDSVTTRNDTLFTNRESSQPYRVGLINMNMDTQIFGLFVGGTLSAPQSQPMDENHPDSIFMSCAPPCGTRYSFTPNSN